MIIVSLSVSNKDYGKEVADCIIKNKFSLNVFGNYFDYFDHNNVPANDSNQVYVLQFVTKSLLFPEIEATLKQEFSTMEFYISSTPVLHISLNLHDRVKKKVTGISSNLEANEN